MCKKRFICSRSDPIPDRHRSRSYWRRSQLPRRPCQVEACQHPAARPACNRPSLCSVFCRNDYGWENQSQKPPSKLILPSSRGMLPSLPYGETVDSQGKMGAVSASLISEISRQLRTFVSCARACRTFVWCARCDCPPRVGARFHHAKLVLDLIRVRYVS